MCGDKLAMVPLSNNTISDPSKKSQCIFWQQTMGAVKLSEKFSLQFDETTDIGNDAQLMVLCDIVRMRITWKME